MGASPPLFSCSELRAVARARSVRPTPLSFLMLVGQDGGRVCGSPIFLKLLLHDRKQEHLVTGERLEDGCHSSGRRRGLGCWGS